MSEKTPKQQLMIARQQLDKLSLFIAGLADFFYGASPAIDDEFQQIKKLLSGKPDYAKASEISTGLNAQLKQESKFIQRKNADTLNQIQSSLRQISEIDAVDSTVKSEIKSFIKNLVPNESDKVSAPIKQFELALSLVKKALSNNVVANDQAEKLAQKDLHDKITQELKALIAPFHKQDRAMGNDSAIIEIQQKLNEGLGHKELLECCLTMIRFIIKDLMTETSAASKLINEIHQSLTKINHGIKSTINRSKSRLDQQVKRNQAMKKQIIAMESTVSGTNELADLKRQTSEYLNKLQDSIQLGEQEERSEQEKMIALLQTMQKRLEALEEKAEKYKQKLVQQRANAMTDSLTKLPNRMAYEERIKIEYEKQKKEKGKVFLAILDIDHFKNINDKYGHSVGDKTLQVMSNHIQKHLHGDDFVARWGGEEFVAILFDDDLTSSFDKLEKLRIAIGALPFKFKGNRVTVTVSIGVVDMLAYNNTQQAFEAADKLLYSAKQNGRNITCR
ncbi:diguanylate cyclase [Glaciecola petra]|uniref:diguanylate cyclase n=1 Tax=Glaciecola petra TaxID=3075602 RepID=A0ABU2ZM29_9ALTE|nr:diguanylate cyclase [Aestuariibacter sp. P117]MDT0593682.1 diguanylate cyclase [Aestuariibacter sp. P117]